MAIARTDTIPANGGMAAIEIITFTNGGVLLKQGAGREEQTIVLHAYQAAEIAGFLLPADVPKVKHA